MIRKNRDIYLDLFRYVLVFFVISIHFNNGSKFLPIFRLAVPMFFMISGFYNSTQDRAKQKTKNIKLIKASLKYLIIGFAIYFVYDLLNLFVYKTHINFAHYFTYYSPCFITRDFILLNIPITSGYHLWFLIALFVVAIMHFCACELKLEKCYPFLIPILLLVPIGLGGYFHLIADYNIPLILTRNAAFTGFPCFLVGYLLGKNRDKEWNTPNKILFFILSILTVGLSMVEGLIIETEIYISSILASIFIILFLSGLRTKRNKFYNFYYKWIGPDSAFYIYILHIAIGDILIKPGMNDFFSCILVFIISFMLYEIIHIIVKSIELNKHKMTSNEYVVNVENKLNDQ